MQKQFQSPLDDRASIGPILDGSRVTLALELNRPVPAPASESEVSAFLARHLPELADASELTTNFSGTSWTFSWTAHQSKRAVISLVDEYGITSTTDSLLRFDVAQDQPATAAILDPPQDESVLPYAVVDATAEGRDDVGITRVRLTAQTAIRPATSPGAAPEPSGDPEVLSTILPDDDATALHTELRTSAQLELSSLNLNPGDEVWLRAAVLDLLSSSKDGPEIVSPVRRLRIISESTLAEQIQAELASIREAAKRIATDQSKLSASRPQSLANAEQAAEQRSRQDGVTDRLSPMKDVLDRLSNRVERNRASDSSLEQLLRDVSTARSEAEQASREAAGKLDELGRRASDTPATPQQEAALSKAQDQAEQNIEEIVQMLDRGRDGWAARRSLERILTEQKQLAQQTRAGEVQRQGKRREDLSQLENDELDRQAQRQEELANRTQALVDTFEQQSKQLEKADPGQAQAMKRAAETGRRQDTAQKQRDAAQQLQQNQTQSAQQNQQQAQRALEQMLGELEKAEQRRDEALRRTIAELLESLERLRDSQVAELSRLAQQIQGQAQTKLPEGMIAVNQATIAVTALVAPMTDPGDLPLLLKSASNAQEAAILTLRASPPDLVEADANERRSLARIEEAIAEAKKLDEKAEDRLEERARQELAKVYQEILEQQLGLNAKVSPLIGKPPGRREASLLRSISPDQDALRLRLEELRTKTDGLEETQFFKYAHDRLNDSMKRAADLLKQASTARALERDQAAAVRVLASLVQALKNDEQQKDDLRDNENDQDGQGQGGAQAGKPGVLPPGAELKLLRLMQVEAAERTRALEQASDAEELEDIGALQQELHQRALKLLESLNEGLKVRGPVEVQPPKNRPPPDQPKQNDQPAERPS
jgi:hypothetical protein